MSYGVNLLDVFPCSVSGYVGQPCCWDHSDRKLGLAVCSLQFGRASAPIMPQFVHTMLRPNDRTSMSSGSSSTLKVTSWWQLWHSTFSPRTPIARILPSVIGGPLVA